MAVAHGPLQLGIEGVVQADHAQIGIEGELTEPGKTNGIQTIALRGVIARRHKGPQLTDGWRQALTTGIAGSRARGVAKAGNIARLQEIADGVPSVVLEAKNALAHGGGGHQAGYEGCIAPAAPLVIGVEVGFPDVG